MEEQLMTTEEQTNETIEKLSKNQQKKLKKRMKWLENKQERRKASKEKKKRKLADRREKGEDIGPSRKNLKLNRMKDSLCKIKVVLDLSLEEFMADKDITSLTSQIQHCYSANRRAANPMQLYACGLGGRTQQRLDNIGDYKGWDIHFNEDSYDKAFPKESLVYLSSESPNILTSLSEDKVYVIGGLVDHNSHKGLCHRLAEEKGIAHAQLPISEFIHLKGRKVLAVNHVFSILLRFTETGDWKKAFIMELPSRKGFSPLFDESGSKTCSDCEDRKDVTVEQSEERDLLLDGLSETNQNVDNNTKDDDIDCDNIVQNDSPDGCVNDSKKNNHIEDSSREVPAKTVENS